MMQIKIFYTSAEFRESRWNAGSYLYRGNFPGFAQTTISVARGVGNGQFTPGPTSPVVDNGIGGGTVADLNGDGKLDYAATGGYPNDVYEFLLGDGHGTFNLATTFAISNV
jgi:hypothetical protein